MVSFPGLPDDWYEGNPADWTGAVPEDLPEHLSGTMANELIADRIVASVRSDPTVQGLYLEIHVQNRVVILRGEVASAEARTTIRRLAWSTPGVRDVCNLIGVIALPGIEPAADQDL